MGHLFHGTSRALVSQVLKYGVRTINGSTGGVREEQLESAGSSTKTAANADLSRILEIGLLDDQSKEKLRMESSEVKEVRCSEWSMNPLSLSEPGSCKNRRRMT
jgi:hypothetical protein